MVSVVSSRTVRPPPRPRRRIPLTTWDVPMLSANYIQKGLLFHKPTATLLPTTAHVVDHLAAALAEALVDYYPVAGRFVTDQHYRGEVVVGCSVSIDCAGQGVQVVHAVADEGVSMADVIPPDADVPPVVQSFFLLDGAINYDGRDHPLLERRRESELSGNKEDTLRRCPEELQEPPPTPPPHQAVPVNPDVPDHPLCQ